MSAFEEWKLAGRALVCFLEAGCSPLNSVNGFKALMDTVDIANKADHVQETINDMVELELLPPNYAAAKPNDEQESG